MKFLITNDDGVHASGISALASVARRFGDVVIVAPDVAHSGCGHRVTTDSAIHVSTHGEQHYSISGTPADCVRVALWELASDVDWVLSGINAGGNLGVDVFMSGTVAAVREGVLLGKPGIAISHYHRTGSQFDWNRAQELAARAISQILVRETSAGQFWNVNLPDLAGSESVPELVDCELARPHLHMHFERDDDGLRYKGDYHSRPRSNGDDVDVCFSGNVAISRMGVWSF